MNQLHALMAFSEVARQGGFAAAAREMGQAPSTVAKSVARLEDELGARLFHRTTRSVSLTDDGQRLFARCERVLAELEGLREEAEGARAEPRGCLRLDLPVAFGRGPLMPVLVALQQRHPAMTLDIRLSDAYADLVRDGLDAAVRVGDLDDSSLVARRFAWQSMVMCAAPAYLRQAGTPRRPNDLARHRFVLYRQHTSGRDRPVQLRDGGRAVSLKPEPVARFNDGEAMARAAVLGLGLTQLPHYMVEDDLRAGRLQEVLRRHRPPDLPIHVVMPAQRQVPARVRALVEALVEWGQSQPKG